MKKRNFILYIEQLIYISKIEIITLEYGYMSFILNGGIFSSYSKNKLVAALVNIRLCSVLGPVIWTLGRSPTS